MGTGLNAAAELLPGFVYTPVRLSGLGADEQWRFHLAQLRFLLCAPSLLSRNAGAHYGFSNAQHLNSVWHASDVELAIIQHWLAQLSELATPERDAMLRILEPEAGAAPLRLGRYAEKLLGIFLRTGPLFNVCAEQLPLQQALDQQGHRTIGELDFLLHDSDGVLRHWELAVKFFCFEPTEPGRAARAGDFVGPDGADSLDRKLTKVFGAQLQRNLPEPFDNSAVWRQAYSAGYLFYPLNTAPVACALVNPAHRFGHWLTPAQLPSLPEAHYLALPRWRWLAPAEHLSNDRLLAKRELPARLARHWHAQSVPSAVMLAQLDAAGQECARYFVRCSVRN